MDIYIAALTVAFTPQVLIALVGALTGASISWDIKSYGPRLTFLMTVLTLAAAGVASEYVSIEHGTVSVFTHFLLGGFTGLFGLRLLDALRLAAPGLTRKIVDIFSNSVLDNIALLIKKITAFFGI